MIAQPSGRSGKNASSNAAEPPPQLQDSASHRHYQPLANTSLPKRYSSPARFYGAYPAAAPADAPAPANDSNSLDILLAALEPRPVAVKNDEDHGLPGGVEREPMPASLQPSQHGSTRQPGFLLHDSLDHSQFRRPAPAGDFGHESWRQWDQHSNHPHDPHHQPPHQTPQPPQPPPPPHQQSQPQPPQQQQQPLQQVHPLVSLPSPYSLSQPSHQSSYRFGAGSNFEFTGAPNSHGATLGGPVSGNGGTGGMGYHASGGLSPLPAYLEPSTYPPSQRSVDYADEMRGNMSNSPGAMIRLSWSQNEAALDSTPPSSSTPQSVYSQGMYPMGQSYYAAAAAAAGQPYSSFLPSARPSASPYLSTSPMSSSAPSSLPPFSMPSGPSSSAVASSMPTPPHRPFHRKRDSLVMLDSTSPPAKPFDASIGMVADRKRTKSFDLGSRSSRSSEGEDGDAPPLDMTPEDIARAAQDPEAKPRRQKLRYPEDLYTPSWVRFSGPLKEGYCDTCHPGKWLQLKNSAYWYHKQFYHGISSVSGQHFTEPLERRIVDGDIVEGYCHQCQQWIAIQNAKRRNSVLWYRHAHRCHVYSKPKSLHAKKSSVGSKE
ncbi:uncharacterized protein VTP21DRAFT_9218 [Calcarisporiella thermophila]|uniref:uncharacterized protein n=1 Tax=Calcarisporiella thermophila TaxID=911321 RepID=UPI003743CD11